MDGVYMINVEYTGKWPNMCSGNLIIYRNKDKIYTSNDYSFRSTGSVGFENDDYNYPFIETGKLVWEDKDYEEYNKWLVLQSDQIEINEAVEKLLSSIEVCCGGCL